MPVASDTILDWIAKDGYSLSQAGWIRAQDRQFYFEVMAEMDGLPIGLLDEQNAVHVNVTAKLEAF